MGYNFDRTRIYFCIAAFVFDVLLCFFTLAQYHTGSQSRRFRILVIVTTGATLLECVRPCLVSLPDSAGAYLLLRVVQSLCFIASTGIAYSYTLYLDSFMTSSTRLRAVFRNVNRAVYLLYCLVLLANIFSRGWVAGYNAATRVWTHGPLYLPVGYSAPVFFLLYSLGFFMRDIRKMERRVRYTMFASIGVALLAVVIQPVVSGRVLLSSFGIALSVYLWYFAVENYDYRRLMDVTEELRLAEQKAQAASLAKSAFLANMSHEIRTPMNAVLGLDEMILRSESKAEIDEYARNIQSAGHTLLSIINDILDFSKIESGKMSIVAAPYRLSLLLDDVGRMIGMRAAQKGLSYRADIDGSLPDELVGDEVRVRQIIINVLNNAVKYTERGSVSLIVRGRREGGLLRLEVVVSDTGIGIKKEHMASLFKSFERIEEDRTHAIEGTGLGLAIVYQLVRLMDGTISVESEYGNGSVFTIVFPQDIGGDATVDAALRAARQQQESPRPQAVAPEARVLVVDDNTINLMVAEGLLRSSQVQVTSCASGEECLQLMRRHKFDVIFLDHMMPGMDGVETLRRSRSMPDNKNLLTPVIALTANALAGMREQYIAQGFTDYISKPIDVGLLNEVLFRNLRPELVIPASVPPDGAAGADALPAGDDGAAEKDAAGKDAAVPSGAAGAAQAAPPAASLVAQYSQLTAARADADPLIDQAAGISLCANNRKMYFDLLKVFCSEKGGIQAQFIKFLMAEDWKNYAVLAHALKSNARVVGSDRLSDMARQFETACNDIVAGLNVAGRVDFVQHTHGKLMRLYNAVAAEAEELGRAEAEAAPRP